MVHPPAANPPRDDDSFDSVGQWSPSETPPHLLNVSADSKVYLDWLFGPGPTPEARPAPPAPKRRKPRAEWAKPRAEWQDARVHASTTAADYFTNLCRRRGWTPGRDGI